MKIKETMLLMIKAVLMMIVITASESTFEMYWERDFENGVMMVVIAQPMVQ